MHTLCVCVENSLSFVHATCTELLHMNFKLHFLVGIGTKHRHPDALVQKCLQRHCSRCQSTAKFRWALRIGAQFHRLCCTSCMPVVYALNGCACSCFLKYSRWGGTNCEDLFWMKCAGPRGMGPPQGNFSGGPPPHFQQGPPRGGPGGMPFQGGPPQHGPGPNNFGGGPPQGPPSWGPPRF